MRVEQVTLEGDTVRTRCYEGAPPVDMGHDPYNHTPEALLPKVELVEPPPELVQRTRAALRVVARAT